MKRFVFGLAAVLFFMVGACSLLNAPATEEPLSAGQGGQGGAPIPCTGGCGTLDDDCNTGVCDMTTNTCKRDVKNVGKACTGTDKCIEGGKCDKTGACTGTQKQCTPEDDCHTVACDSTSGMCVNTVANDGSSCDDGDPCTGDGVCHAGKCSKGTDACGKPPYTTKCQQGTCVQGQGCTSTPISGSDGKSCTDGLNPTCATGACTSGTCVPTPIPGIDGKPCSTGDYCQVNATCAAGVCANATPRDCPTSDPCLVPTCDSKAQTCRLAPAKDGAKCDDASSCTIGTTCQAGKCGHPTATIAACGTADGCCPKGCSGGSPDNDPDCTIFQPGVQTNVDMATLEASGWVVWQAAYYGDQEEVDNCCPGGAGSCCPGYSWDEAISGIPGTKWLIGCGDGTETTLTVAAMTTNPAVFNICTGYYCNIDDNSIRWYVADDDGDGVPDSVGFAPAGDAVDHDYSDYASKDGSQRMTMVQYLNSDANAYEVGVYGRCGTNTYPEDPTNTYIWWIMYAP